MGFSFNKDDIEFDAGQNIVVIRGWNILDLEHGLVLELQRPQIQKLTHIFPQPIVKVHLFLKPAYCEIALHLKAVGRFARLVDLHLLLQFVRV